MQVSKSDRTLTINGRELSFDQRVHETVEIDNTVIIELLVDDFAVGDPLVGRNILAFNEQGELLWRVQANGMTRPSRFGGETPEAYFGLWIDERGKLKTFIPTGFELEIDPKTGEISNPVFTK